MPVRPRAEGTVAERLSAAGCVAATDEAEELVTAAPDADTLECWVRRREVGEPLAWITGSVRFCGRTVRVTQAVYVPRPQTEDLARRAATLLATTGGRAVDMCAGTGAIATHLLAEVPSATVVAVDIDRRAAVCARGNGVPAIVGDLGDALRSGGFDVVTAVAPYVPTRDLRYLPADVQRQEPRLALDGGDDGLDVVRRVVRSAARLLRPGGSLLIEVGGDQDRALASELSASGFGPATPWFDDEADLRGLAARLLGVRCPE